MLIEETWAPPLVFVLTCPLLYWADNMWGSNLSEETRSAGGNTTLVALFSSCFNRCVSLHPDVRVQPCATYWCRGFENVYHTIYLVCVLFCFSDGHFLKYV